MSSQTLAALHDQDSFYDVTDCLEQLGMESIVQKHMNSSGIEADLKQQFIIYEVNSHHTFKSISLQYFFTDAGLR